jgi:hypothetical protein
MNIQDLLRLPNKRVTQKQYNTVKYITIIYGALSGVLDLYIAFLFGEGKYTLALILLCVAVILTLLDSVLWIWVLEQIGRKKVEHGKRLGNGKKNGGK